MKSIVPFLVVPSLCISLASCVTATAAGPLATAEVAEPSPVASDGPEPGTRVIKDDLVQVDPGTLASEPFPADVAKTVFSPDGCENGPGAVELVNATEFAIELKVDGKGITVLGEKAASKVVPSRSKVYLCLDPKAAHVIAGTMYKLFGDTVYALPEAFESDLAVKKDGPTTFTVTYKLIAKHLAAPIEREE